MAATRMKGNANQDYKDYCMGFLTGKRILITGVASKLSIAYGIAQAMHLSLIHISFLQRCSLHDAA